MIFSKFLIEDKYNQYEAKTLYDLSSATPEVLSLNELFAQFFTEEEKQQTLNELLNLKLSYSEQFGLASTRQKLASTIYANSGLSAENFMITTGASEAIFLVFSTLFNAGDKIIVQKPIYQSLYQIALDRGVEIIDWDYEIKQSFAENLNTLSKLLMSHSEAKALVINNPNNPLGIGFDEGRLTQISKLIEERLLIADEVARGISLRPIKSAIEVHTNSIVISDLSKSYSLPGLRLGWIACKYPSLFEKFSAQKNYLSLRSPILSELIAEKVLDHHLEIAAKNRKLIAENLESVFSLEPSKNFFACDFDKNEILGHCIFPKLTKDQNYLDQLFVGHGIFIAEGKLFGKQYQGRIRIGLAKNQFKNQSIEEKQSANIEN